LPFFTPQGFAHKFSHSRELVCNLLILCADGTCREIDRNPEFVHGFDQAANVVTENLAQHFVPHRPIGLGSDAVAELCLD
jgi:hypothetical protein